MSRSDDSDNDFDDNESGTNSSSAYSYMNSFTTNSYTTNNSSNYSLNDKRKSRNQNEKKRRDQFNSLIVELAALLNHARKIDKATVLSETLYFFHNYNQKPLYDKEIEFRFKPFFLQNDEFMRFMIEFQNAFCLVFDLNGQIKYVSDHILHLLGHYPKNLQDCILYDLIDEKSGKYLKSFLTKKKFVDKDTINLPCQFKKATLQSNAFESVEIKGFFKSSSGHFNTIVKLDAFLAINQLFPQDDNKREFTSEFSLDLKYISLDPKAPEIIGYSPIEVLGTLVYDYCHHEDLDKIIESHQKLLNEGAVPAVSYRYRTKGHQWLWLETRFELLNNGFNCKNYAILAHNKVVTLNEMLDSHEILDSSSTTASCFDQNTPIGHLIPVSVKNENMSPNSKIIDEIDAFERKDASSFSSNWQQQSESNVFEDSETFADKSDTSSMADLKLKFTSPFVSDISGGATTFTKDDIDDELEAIFVKSFKDIKYRHFLLKQLRMKKAQIENIIRKKQDELQVLEATMENIVDEKKLENWHLEFQRQQQHAKQHQNQQQQYIEENVNKKGGGGSRSEAAAAAAATSSGSGVKLSHKYPHAPSPSSSDSSNSLLSYIMPSIKLDAAMRQHLQSTEKMSNGNEKIVGSGDLKKRSISTESSTSAHKRRSLPLTHPRLLENSPVINEIFADLIQLQNMPSSNESQPDVPPSPNTLQNLLNNNNNKTSNNNNSRSSLSGAAGGGSSGSLQQQISQNQDGGGVSFDMEDEINSEMIDKLFNQYSFDSFNSQQ